MRPFEIVKGDNMTPTHEQKFEDMGILEMAKTIGEMGDKMKSPHPSLDEILKDILRNYTTDTIMRHLADDLCTPHKCGCVCENCMECSR